MIIHPSAIIEEGCCIGEGVHIGANAYIGANVDIGKNTFIHPHVVIDGHVEIGENNAIFPGAVIGLAPQDKTYEGESSTVVIGNNNVFREYVTINRATGANSVTQIGNANMIMAYCHIAHNCRIANNVTLANSVSLGGHVVIESDAVLGGVLGVHQFTHIGQISMVGGMSRVDRDVPPFTLVEGNPARIRGLNKIGLDRNGRFGDTGPEEIIRLKSAFKALFADGLALSDKVAVMLKKRPQSSPEYVLAKFLEQSMNDPTRRGPLPRQAPVNSGAKAHSS